MRRKIINFFDRLEDKVRAALSHRPIIYALIGGTGVVLFWKGVWETADLFPFLFGPVSILVSVMVLLLTGLFVSFFIGDSIIISGFKKEKKLAEKTEMEISSEINILNDLKVKIEKIEKDLEEIKSKL